MPIVEFRKTADGVIVSLEGFEREPSVYYDIHGNVTVGPMGNTYNNYGQAGAFGENPNATNTQQIWQSSGRQIDLPTLAAELAKFRANLAKEPSAQEHSPDLESIAAAENAAKDGNGPGALEHLKSAGAWVWDTGTKIGIGVAIVAAKTALGL